MASWALRAISEKEEARSELEEWKEDREAAARPEDNKIEEARREVVKLLRTLLAT